MNIVKDVDQDKFFSPNDENRDNDGHKQLRSKLKGRVSKQNLSAAKSNRS